MRKLIIVIAILFFIPMLFFVIGILMGLLYPNVPRSNFYAYYRYMLPSLFLPGIFVSICYLVIFKGETR